MKTIKALITALSLTMFTQSLSAKEYQCYDEKSLPKLTEGCEGEACDFYHYERALSDIQLFSKPDLKSKQIGIIKKCEKLNGLKVYMVVKRYGKAKVLKTSTILKKLKIKKNDVTTIQRYGGEGYLFLCINKIKNIDALMSAAGVSNDPKVATVKVLNNTITEEWIRLIDKKGNSGYAQRTEKTVMWYATYSESKLCDPSHKKDIKHF